MKKILISVLFILLNIVSFAQQQIKIQDYATLAAVQTTTQIRKMGDKIFVKSLNGIYAWDATSTASHNGTTIIKQNSEATGRFLLINPNTDWNLTGNAGSVQETNFLGTTDNVGLSLRTNNQIRQTITNAGNVGIGITEPVSKLDIAGSSTDIEPILRLRSGNGNTDFNNGTQIAFSFDNTNQYNHFIHSRHNSVNSNNALDFYVSNGTANNTVTAGSIHTMSLNSGNVGVGTTTPANKLHIGTPTVANTGGIRLPITSTSPAQTGQPIGVNANGDIVRLATTNFDATVSFSTVTPTTGGVVFTPNTPANTTVLYVSAVDGSQWTYNGTTYVTQPASADWKTAGNAGSVQATNFVGTTDNVGLSFRTNNVIRQTISNTGNVGIGTTTPTVQLEVVGQTKLSFGAASGAIDMGADLNATTRTSNFRKFGNIVAPDYSNTKQVEFLTFDSQGPADARLSFGGRFGGTRYSATEIAFVTSPDLTTTGGNTRMFINNIGNVGIGTTAPIYKLDVNSNVGGTGFGASNAGYAVYRFGNSGGVFHGNKLIFTGFGGTAKLGNINTFETATGSNVMSLGSGTNENALNIASSGNVGVGTTTPTAKLEINNVTAGSGLKFTQLNASSTPTAGATPLGVDASGNVVATAGSIFISVDGGNQNIGQGFTTVAMPNIVSVTGIPASNYNTATSEFTVPVTGVYEITGTIRYNDGQPAGKQFGVGVHTANSDGPFFLWHAIQNTTYDGVQVNGSRRTSFPYIRVERFTAGQTLRMISYVDGSPMNVATAAMQIRFLF